MKVGDVIVSSGLGGRFPAGYPGVIGVAATDKQGRRASFSSDNLSVLVSAPGVGVPVVRRGSGYDLSEGTSSAAALISGVAALIKSRHPGLRGPVKRTGWIPTSCSTYACSCPSW